MSTKDEAERLAEEKYARLHLHIDAKYVCQRKWGFIDGFRTGEKSERVQRLVEAARIATDCWGDYSPPSVKARKALDLMNVALASFNASPEEKK